VLKGLKFIKFILAQHSRDIILIKSLIKYFGASPWKLTVDSPKPIVYFYVEKFTDVSKIILPFFNKYSLHGCKRLDYADFVKVTALMEVQAHLTNEGLDRIREIKSGMNRARK
jgi:hypothetical protein